MGFFNSKDGMGEREQAPVRTHIPIQKKLSEPESDSDSTLWPHSSELNFKSQIALLISPDGFAVPSRATHILRAPATGAASLQRTQQAPTKHHSTSIHPSDRTDVYGCNSFFVLRAATTALSCVAKHNHSSPESSTVQCLPRRTHGYS